MSVEISMDEARGQRKYSSVQVTSKVLDLAHKLAKQNNCSVAALVERLLNQEQERIENASRE